MSATNPTVHVQEIVLSPMQVFANGVDLGGTTEGVTLSIKTEFADIMVDQFGKTILDKRVLGHVHGMKFTLAEVADPVKLKAAFPHGKLVGTSPNQSFYFDLEIGDSLINHATAWTFHPVSQIPTDYSRDVNIFLGASTSASELKYDPSKQTGMAVELVVFPDTTTTPPRLMVIGDLSNGAVNATAAAAVAGGGIVGNGTVTNPAPNNAATKSEMITISCIGAGAAGFHNWLVVGSLSGILGEYTLSDTVASVHNFVPSAPTPQAISFTMTQGSVAFALGDSFTIATVAANFV